MGRISNAKERLMEAIGQLIWVGSYGSTTIDDICAKAGVKKGSFYYFFECKADLAIAAIDADWQERRRELDAIFSPIVPPLERFKKLGEYIYRAQTEAKKQFGCVLGCPLFALGAEVSTQESKLQKKIEEVLNYKRMYFESAIREAHAAGLVHAPDPGMKARMLFTFYQGLLTEARIRNDLEILRDAARGAFQLLGVPEEKKTSRMERALTSFV
ncbi:MAG TPA: TetR/AcrR family transcriptional regulator [Verrucomicrobiae bacterium]|nr:TetR/AcrR family transcriptional regulator [Verrucomicrobiae bacterium]